MVYQLDTNMQTAEVLDKINNLPHHVQEQLFHYVDFLYEKYQPEHTIDVDGHSDASDDYELTEEGRLFLEERIRKAESNPEKRKDWRTAINQIHEKHNWPLIPTK
jgi:hypothetical protein